MAFNFKAFATAFMDDQAKQIQKRIQDAEDYEDQQREQAERNKSVVGKRRALVNLAKTEINMLRKLGAKDKHINAAIAAGPKVLFEFSQALQKEAQKRPSSGGNVTFSESELDTFIEMPDEFAAESMDPAEHYANSIGLSAPTLGSYESKKQNLLKTALGMGLKDVTRAKLDKDAYYEGYSVMDINEIARQEAYESMDPGTYFSFKPSVDYNPVTVGPAFRDAYADAGELSPALESELQRRFPEFADYEREKAKVIARQQAGVVDAYAQRFGRRFLEDTSINLPGLLGNELYTSTYVNHSSMEDLERYIVDNLLDMEDVDIGTTIKTKDGDGRIIEITLGENDEVSRMTIDKKVVDDDDVPVFMANLQKQGLLNQSSIRVGQQPFPAEEDDTVKALGTVEYIKNGTVMKGVPPRPNAFMSRITGFSLDADTREKILSGEMPIPEKGLRVDEWDELFGDTHNPDGTPKVSTTPKQTIDKPAESDILDLRKYKTMEEKYEAFDALPIGGSYYDDDGSGPHTKGMERNG
jgi:hypothetical protein